MNRNLLFIFFILTGTSFGVLSQTKGLQLSPQPGLHEGLKTIELQIEKGYRILYTIDGSDPKDTENEAVKRVYRKTISTPKNTVFRFLIIAPDYSREEFVASYFVERKHTIGVISVVTNPAYFFDSLEGIYMMGCCADTIDPYKGANFWKKEEKPTNIEFYEPDGTCAFNQSAGIRIFGGFSKALRQKSFAVFARKKYGNNRFEYPLFSGRPFKKYKNFVLRNAGGDMIRTHIRDVFATQLVKETGLLMQEYRPVSVYINGEYWGKYNMREKINEHFIKNHFGYPKDSLIIMRHNGDYQHGPPEDYRKFTEKLKEIDVNKKEDLDYLDRKIDIDNHILYNICEIYTGNGDAGGNIRYYKSMRDTAKWRWIFYDLDQGMNITDPERHLYNSLIDFTTYKDEIWPNPPWSTLIIRKLFESDSIKAVYINRFLDLIHTTFKAERALNLLEHLVDEVKEEIPYHLKRWGVPEKKYKQSLDGLKLFIEKRPELLIEHIKERFDLSKTTKINITAPNKEEGFVWFNSLQIKEDYEGVYFQEIPVFLEANPRFDYDFVKWNDNDSSKTRYFQVNDDKKELRAIFKHKPFSHYYGKIIISEIDATQSDDKKSDDWIELFNNSKDTIDISNWSLRDEKDGHVFFFPEGAKIFPKEHLLVLQNEENWKEIYKTDTLKTIGSFYFGIGYKSDKIRIYDNQSAIVDKVNLSVFDKKEEGFLNYVKRDYRKSGLESNNWILEQPSPGEYSSYYNKLLKREEKDLFIKNIFLLIGCISALILVVVFFVSLLRGRVFR